MRTKGLCIFSFLIKLDYKNVLTKICIHNNTVMMGQWRWDPGAALLNKRGSDRQSSVNSNKSNVGKAET